MSRTLKVGLGLLVGSVISAATNLWASEAFPSQWGGTNIGGGLLLLLSYLGVVTGVVLIVAGIVSRRRRRDS